MPGARRPCLPSLWLVLPGGAADVDAARAEPVIGPRSRWPLTAQQLTARAQDGSGRSRIASRIWWVDHGLDGQTVGVVDNGLRVSLCWQSAAVSIASELLARIVLGAAA